MDEALARDVLKEAKRVLDAHNVEYWLNFGALLGAVREGKFITYDDDVELNTWAHNINEEQIRDVCMDLCERGFNVYYSTLTDYISIRKHGIPIAFSTFTLEGQRAVRPHEPMNHHGIGIAISRFPYALSELFARERVGKLNRESLKGFKRCCIFLAVTLTHLLPRKVRRKTAIALRKISAALNGTFGKTSYPASFYSNLRDMTFYGEVFKVPRDTEKYLEFVYGPNWKDLKTLIELVQPHVGTRLFGLPDFEANQPGFDRDGKSGGDHAQNIVRRKLRCNQGCRNVA